MAAKREREKPEPTTGMTAAGRQLGAYLADLRTVKKLTLREVEEATGREVSNAYLSQLENGKISRPSPNILHALARVYGVSYDTLMEKAGYISPSQPTTASVLRSGRATSRSEPVSALANQNITKAEEEQLLEYLAFLRRRKGKR